MTVDTPGRTILELVNAGKTFPGQVALSGVNLSVLSGEIYGLVGQNGSGKSTLIKILSGFHHPDAGTSLTFDGETVELPDVAGEWRERLHFIHQDLGLIPSLSTLDNIGLGTGYQTTWWRRIKWRAERRNARGLQARLGVQFDLAVPVAKLAPAERTAVALIRALQDWGTEPGMLILDEPTTSFPAGEVKRLFSIMRGLADTGSGMIFVSHRLDEVFEICDRVGVLRDGLLVAEFEVGSVTQDELVMAMAGRSLASEERRESIAPSADELMTAEDLTGESLTGLTFRLHAGEILGIAGTVGSGREEVAALLSGQARALRGRVTIAGEDVTRTGIASRIALGLGVVPSERARLGLVMGESVRENLTLPWLKPFAKWGVLSRQSERIDVADWIARMQINPPDSERPVRLLSGGNAQKVVLGKWLRRGCTVLVLDEPTQGVDVSAKRAIHNQILAAAAAGLGVLVCSTEEAELVELCHRVIAVRRDLPPRELLGDITESRILLSMSAQPTAEVDHE